MQVVKLRGEAMQARVGPSYNGTLIKNTFSTGLDLAITVVVTIALP